MQESQLINGSVFPGQDHPGVVYLRPVAIRFAGNIMTETDSVLARRNQETLQKAVFILSQSDTGRYLLEAATATGCRIAFDQEKVARIGAQGMLELPANKILLGNQDDPARLALSIAHECAHAVQFAQLRDLMPSSRLTPQAYLKTSFAIEADAYAHQMQVALELAHAASLRPGLYGTPQLLQAMYEDYPAFAKATASSLHHVADLISGKVMAAGFKAFFNDPQLRKAYQKYALNAQKVFVTEARAQNKSLRNLFNQEDSGRKILKHIRWRGFAYATHYLRAFRLDDPQNCGLDLAGHKKLRDFYNRVLPDHAPPKWKILARIPKNGA